MIHINSSWVKKRSNAKNMLPRLPVEWGQFQPIILSLLTQVEVECGCDNNNNYPNVK